MMEVIRREQKVSILLVEQNASLALEVADHAYLLETGRVVLGGPAEAVRRDESVRKSYLGY
jgi:branched-chain amino acid transport system ATP-binding protein